MVCTEEVAGYLSGALDLAALDVSAGRGDAWRFLGGEFLRFTSFNLSGSCLNKVFPLQLVRYQSYSEPTTTYSQSDSTSICCHASPCKARQSIFSFIRVL